MIPRALAGFGLLAVLLHTAGIPLPMFLGYPSVLPLGFSLALSHLAVGAWLAVKGFKESHLRPSAEVYEVELIRG